MLKITRIISNLHNSCADIEAIFSLTTDLSANPLDDLTKLRLPFLSKLHFIIPDFKKAIIMIAYK